MAADHVETIDRAVDAFNRRDIDDFLALIAPDVEFVPAVVVMEGRYRGHDGARRWWRDLFAVFPDWRATADVRPVGRLTLAAIRVSGHGGESGAPVDQTIWQVAAFAPDGRVARMANHATEADALRTAEGWG